MLIFWLFVPQSDQIKKKLKSYTYIHRVQKKGATDFFALGPNFFKY